MNTRQIKGEIERTRSAISRACPAAVASPWLRPPHGFKSPGVLWAVHQARLGLAGWSIDAQDYVESELERVAQNILSRLRPGAIILLHDGPGNAATVAALPAILQGLKEQGWQPVLLPSTSK